MIVKLFCPKCAYEASKNFDGYTVLEVPVPVSKLSDDGRYKVHCEKGHVSAVILDNVKFELLFEIGLNAIIDGYPREAVSSFASALERFYEFYWRVVMCHFDLPTDQVDSTWKPLSKLSERQVGAYSTASILLTKRAPILLNPNKAVQFRNSVIHSGYVPTEEEAISFGDIVMQLITNNLSELRSHAEEALQAIYKEVSPKGSAAAIDDDDSVIVGCANILTAIDVKYPPKTNDKRAGGVADQFRRIIDDRHSNRMELLSEEEMQKRFPGMKMPKINKSP